MEFSDMKISANFSHLRDRHKFILEIVLLKTLNGLEASETQTPRFFTLNLSP